MVDTISGETAASKPVPPKGADLAMEVDGLTTYFFTRQGIVKAVDDVSFYLEKGETLGIVGESGCGKSITALSVMRLVPDPPGKTVAGTVNLDGRNLLELTDAEMRDVRGNEMSMIFQEPMTALNPVFRIGHQISEALILHQGMNTEEALKRSVEMLELVKIPEAEQRVREYPHQLSGGMRQRVMIAMALACNPKVLIADEPTTALDVTIEAQILELMRELHQTLGMSVMIITHDLGVVAELSRNVLVMYLGQDVEYAPVQQLFSAPKHPYTRELLASIPKLGRKSGGRLHTIRGSVPSLYERPGGCPFHPRCRQMIAGVCDVQAPPVVDLDDGHQVRCFLYGGPEHAGTAETRPRQV